MGALLSGAGAPEERQVPLDVRVLAEPLEPRRDDLRLLLVAQPRRDLLARALEGLVVRRLARGDRGDDRAGREVEHLREDLADLRRAGGADDLGRGAELGDERARGCERAGLLDDDRLPTRGDGLRTGELRGEGLPGARRGERGLRPVGGELAGAILRESSRAISRRASASETCFAGTTSSAFMRW